MEALTVGVVVVTAVVGLTAVDSLLDRGHHCGHFCVAPKHVLAEYEVGQGWGQTRSVFNRHLYNYIVQEWKLSAKLFSTIFRQLQRNANQNVDLQCELIYLG